jgi:hypothetical protein
LGNTTGWHHFAVAFGAGLASMYWDGQSLGTFAQPINLGTGLSTQIGSSADPTGEGWIGAIDEVAFYAATLAPGAIQAHFLAMVGSAPLPVLSFGWSGNQLTLTWPADASGFTLLYSDGLPATSWLPVPGVVGNSATVPTTNSHRFYRLGK